MCWDWKPGSLATNTVSFDDLAHARQVAEHRLELGDDVDGALAGADHRGVEVDLRADPADRDEAVRPGRDLPGREEQVTGALHRHVGRRGARGDGRSIPRVARRSSGVLTTPSGA